MFEKVIKSDHIFITPIYEDTDISTAIFDDHVMPPDTKFTVFSENKYEIISKDPINNADRMIRALPQDPLPEEIARALFFSYFSPHTISKLLFSNVYPQTLLKEYFKAPVLDFQPLIKVIKILFARIAIPYNLDQLQRLFITIGTVVHELKILPFIDLYSTVHLIASLVFHSYKIKVTFQDTFDDFMKTLKYYKEMNEIPEQYLRKIYTEIFKEQLPLFFSFSHPFFTPDLSIRSVVSVPSFGRWFSKGVYAELKNSVLQFYKDEKKGSPLGGITLSNILFITPVPGKKNFTMTIVTNDLQPTGYVMHSGKPKFVHNPIIIEVPTQNDIEVWRSSVMHSSFYKMFTNMMQLAQWKH